MSGFPQILFMVRIVCLMLFAIWPAKLRAQFTYTNNNGAITITAYTGNVESLEIPNTIDGLPVVSIGLSAFVSNMTLTNLVIGSGICDIEDSAFADCENLASVTIPNSVTNIGALAFAGCLNLLELTLPNNLNSIQYRTFYGCNLQNLSIPSSVTDIGNSAFAWCHFQTLTIPNSVTGIEYYAFGNCHDLTNIIIGNGVTYIADDAFWYCSTLAGIYFLGSAPGGDTTPFYETFFGDSATGYYLPGTIGWSDTLGDLSMTPWLLPYPVILNNNFGFNTMNNQFGFTVSWATNLPVVVEACTNLSNPVWQSVQTNTLTDGWFHFGDQQWTNHPTCFYRIHSQ
jgi:hypothetical protein